MTTPILAAATFCIAVTLIQVASLAIAIVRLRQTACGPLSKFYPPVSLVRPLCGIDNYAADTLRSTFELDYPDCEILFCVATAQDTVLPLVRSLIAENPGARAKLLTGDERVSPNPKLNNVLKGWRAAHHDWIIIADSNVLMCADAARLHPAPVRELARGYRARRLAADRLPAARFLGRDRMRVPQHLSGALAVSG
jgi:ceramide glucosyltransferase